MKGYNGKILAVDLTSGTVEEIALPAQILQEYIGGSGLGAFLMAKYVDPDCDPLGPDNKILFLTGPFTDTKVPTSGRHQVVTKSPLTGIYGEGDAGGSFGVYLKRTGYDGIMISGQAKHPVYLWITDQLIEIRDAEKFWGMDTYQIGPLLQEETNRQAVMATIGPAGEKLVKLAGVFHDNQDARPAARCGMGAVMGAKKLKAVVVYGRKGIELNDKLALTASLKKWRKQAVDATETLGKYGTAGSLAGIEQIGDLPIKNWSQGSFTAGAEKIDGYALVNDQHFSSKYYCRSCIIGCGRTVKIIYGREKGEKGAGPEYESLAMLGAMNLVDDLVTLLKANELCNRYGLDTISTGSVIAFAIEAFEKGYLTSRDTGGLILKWNSAEVLLTLIKKIAYREDIGDLLAEGVRAVSAKLGEGTREFAIHVKGLELPAHDPRAFNSLAVAYATSNRGACHLQGFTHLLEKGLLLSELGYESPLDRFSTENKGRMTKDMQDLMCIFDSLKLCKFFLFAQVPLAEIARWYSWITGNKTDLAELLKIGERIYNLKRLFNLKCGITASDDNIPRRILAEKRGSGGAADNLPPLQVMLADYYQARNWTDGIPDQAILKAVNIEKWW